MQLKCKYEQVPKLNDISLTTVPKSKFLSLVQIKKIVNFSISVICNYRADGRSHGTFIGFMHQEMEKLCIIHSSFFLDF